ncbi:hypothetical protein CHS0354_043052 [Potamilus streckersoni]|uniref:Peroxidase n=1 Tax=Potamilus streckersoni TaxID=2493646 RepID=A0AAE0VTL5_9BIVA|nr:hypothetical protein CHS0354_043052 [Potamilus streckersoni]
MYFHVPFVLVYILALGPRVAEWSKALSVTDHCHLTSVCVGSSLRLVIDTPRSRGVYGTPLPSPRLISNVIHAAGKKAILDSEHTVMEMQWGQFLDHDIVQTPVLKGKMGAAFDCCGEFKNRSECFPIPIPKDDPFFKTDCMNFARSAPVPTQGCNPGYREQMNQVTSYIDGSAVYGSSPEEQTALRTGEQGLLKTGPNNLPPPNDADKCMLNSTEDYCLRAGDSRVNVVPSLGMSHSTFVREHNRIARVLGALNPHWDDETIFQETRKIIAAMIQHITYTEYLPAVFNDDVMTKYNLKSTPKGFNTVYNPKRKATTANSFAVAAFRFGHSQIPRYQARVSHDYQHMTKTPIEFTYHNPHMVEEDNGLGLEDIARWVASDNGLEADRFMEDGYRNLLFLDRQGNSFDLAAVNIQRGRDHGIAPYNHWRTYCGLPAAKTFDTKPGGLVDHDPDVGKLLKQVYSHPDDIDLFTGGLSENFIPGCSVGPTFACILGKQFRAYKEGDRFWYENRFTGIGFTEAQLNEIKKVRMSMVLCNNYKFEKIQTNVFEVPQGKNKFVDCADIPQIDLSKWEAYRRKRPAYPVFKHHK